MRRVCQGCGGLDASLCGFDFAALRLWVGAVDGSMTARSSGCSAQRPLNRPRRRAGGSTAVAVTPESGDLKRQPRCFEPA